MQVLNRDRAPHGLRVRFETILSLTLPVLEILRLAIFRLTNSNPSMVDAILVLSGNFVEMRYDHISPLVKVGK